MADQRIAEQVHGILAMNEVDFSKHPERPSFLVPYESAGVYVDVRDYREGTIVTFRAYVLQDVDASDKRRGRILEFLNEINRERYFGKFWLDETNGYIAVEHELFGENLQSEEFMNALTEVAFLADEMDDEISSRIGSGKRAADIWEEASQSDSSGPVVSA